MFTNMFVKDTSKSSIETIIDNVVSNVVTGLPKSAEGITSTTASSLISSGSSLMTTTALAGSRTDNILSAAADEYFALAARAVSRTAGADIATLRRSSGSSLSTYLEQINPKTKISSKRYMDEYEVLAIL